MRDDGVHFVLAHIDAPQIQVGDQVSAGQVIARVGNNGYSRHPHTHVGAWKGQTALQVRFDLTALGAIRREE
jgi:murein DD-endopeptidase MepM/ murein hydrolase activator NlpD